MSIAYLLLGALAALFLWEQYRQITKLNFVRRLIDTYEHDVDNPALIDAMISAAGIASSKKSLPLTRRRAKTFSCSIKNFSFGAISENTTASSRFLLFLPSTPLIIC